MRNYNNRELRKIAKLNLPIPHLEFMLSLFDRRKEDFSRFRRNMEKLSYCRFSMSTHDQEEPIAISIFPKSFVLQDYFVDQDRPQNEKLYDCYLLHELYHLKDIEQGIDGTISIGFTTVDRNGIYKGLGFNEGCIEMFVANDLKLNGWKTSLDQPQLKPYFALNEVEAILVSMISDIVGEEDLRIFQANHDIISVCEKLGVLSSSKQAEDVVFLLDKIKRNISCFRRNLGLYPEEEIDACSEYILEMGKRQSENIYQGLEEKQKVLRMMRKGTKNEQRLSKE